jgi:Methyltransferase domain
MSAFWDQRFAEPGYKYGIQANAWLQAQAHHLPPGARVLLPGDGEGRNGVWLAQQGHRVWSVDSSPVGLAKARALAAERGVALETECVDLADFDPPPASVDAVVLVFVHLRPALRTAVHRRLAQSLVPGGLMLFEGFHPTQLGRSSGGPKERDMLVSLALLRSDWADQLDELAGWEGEVLLDEGPGHQGAAIVTRWLGRRLGP